MSLILASVFAGLCGGLDLFLCLALLSLIGQLGGLDLPGATDDLGTWWLLTGTGLLYTLEGVAERLPRADLPWRLVGLFVRPTGAAGLAALIIDPNSFGPELWAVAGAAAIALVVQVLRSGWALLSRIDETRPTLAQTLVLEDAYVLILVAALVVAPLGVAVLAAAALVVGLRMGPKLLAAFFLAVTLTRGTVRGLLSRTGWRRPERFPRWMQRQLAPSAIVTGGRLRASPVACLGHPSPGRLSRGWLVVRGREPRFVRPAHRRRVDALALVPGAETSVAVGPSWSTVNVTTADLRRVRLVIPKDGPNPEELLRELS